MSGLGKDFQLKWSEPKYNVINHDQQIQLKSQWLGLKLVIAQPIAELKWMNGLKGLQLKVKKLKDTHTHKLFWIPQWFY